MSVAEKWTILSPVAHAPQPLAEDVKAGPFPLDRSLEGVHVGLRVDYAWICFVTLIDEWETLLRNEGAIPHTLWMERNRNTVEKRDPEEVRADIEEWSRLIDCGLAGLGN